MDLQHQYKKVRYKTEQICKPLKTEDYIPQPIEDVSPPKWHLAHTTWFFETFILLEYLPNYKEYNSKFAFLFNSYYESEGQRSLRNERGNFSRPSVTEIYEYRAYVDSEMGRFLENTQLNSDQIERLFLGLNHEQQHQELLITDIKYILGTNPLHPIYEESGLIELLNPSKNNWIKVPEGIYNIGMGDDNFSFDNERSQHKVYLNKFEISSKLVSNKEYLLFMESGAYENFNYWHSDAWQLIRRNKLTAPLYWQKLNKRWYYYTLAGLKPIDMDLPVTHISYYEAYAYAQWKNLRLPTEFEWEAAANKLFWGQRWEWTESAYLPYPGFVKDKGAIGEYNGKFMVNQKVLRGGSIATSENHSRISYRNFFYPHHRWQFSGIRLAK